MKRRSFLAAFVLLTALLALCGCGGETPAAAEPSPAPTAEATAEPVAAPSAAPTAQPVSGAEVFREYYSRKMTRETEFDHSHTDLSLLEGMASTTVGTVVEDDNLSIEVLGAVFSGSAGEILLRVTAKELDSVLNDNEEKYFTDYQFAFTAPVYGSVSGKRFDDMSHRYIYCDTAPDLAANQFVIHLSFTAAEPFYTGFFTIPLADFGRFKKLTGQIEPLYDGMWPVHIAVDAAEGGTRRWAVDEPVQIGDYRFSVDDIHLTALSGTVHLTCLEDKGDWESHEREITETFFAARDDVTIEFADGTLLAMDPLQISGSAGGSGYAVHFTFSGPVAVEDIVSLHVFETEYPVPPAVEETPEETDAATAFLTAFLTSDYQERYRLFLVADQFRDDLTLEERNAVYVGHSSCVRPYVTEELFDKLLRNRELMRWDKTAIKLGVTMTPLEIELAEVADKPLNYDFSVTIQLEGEHNATAAVTGRLVMEDENTVQSIIISEYKDFPKIG